MYQVLVHSFVRNQLERRWGSIFTQYFLFSHRNDTSLQCICIAIPASL